MNETVDLEGSCPTTHSARPRQILCDSGASMMALAACDGRIDLADAENARVAVDLTTSVSWLPSQRSVTSGRRS